MDRRKFLVTLGGLVVLAGAGADIYHIYESKQLKPLLVPKAYGTIKYISGVIDSKYVNFKPGWTVSIPTGRKLAGIVFCMHGFDNNHDMAFSQLQIPQVAGSLNLNVAVAAVDGGADSYWHKRSDGTDSMTMFISEFIPIVNKLVGNLPQVMMGWSMGGYGAILATEQFPEDFVGVAPASPAIFLAPGLTAPGAFDSPTDFYANDVFTGIAKLNNKAIAVACGTGDPFYNATKDFVADLKTPYYSYFGPGGHDAQFWQAAAFKQLTAIRNSLSW